MGSRPHPRGRGGRGLRTRLGAAVLGMFGGLLAAEVVARIAFFPFKNRLDVRAREKESLFRPSATRFWGLAPGAVVAGERGVPTVDLHALFAERPHAEVFLDAVHPSPAGHALLAGALAPRVDALLQGP